ncbi:hypothetical protein OQX61_01950 [Pedobacter sp. PLR]|uniref:hypothetical protein n=1 Tax=Pedobacter sp. PLR TaxID=2994465 RepID=UPI0022476266|nr:hypothetical protein [Pedobacter sp. PLR]MCX2450022.1 hypothetical protein [Pedobacter sp. PLR]
MDQSNKQDTTQSSAEITRNLAAHTAELKKKTELVNHRLDELRAEADKFLHPEKSAAKNK